MYSERYPPYSRRSWYSGFQQNHAELNHQPYNFRQTPHGRNSHFPENSNWTYDDPNCYNFEDQNSYEPGPGNHRNYHSYDHRMYRDWPESSNSSYNNHEPGQGFDSKYQRSRGNQSCRGKDSNNANRRSKHESNESSSMDNQRSGERDSNNASKRSKHESNESSSRDNQRSGERDSNSASRRSKHESNESSSRDNQRSGERDSNNASKRSKHESNESSSRDNQRSGERDSNFTSRKSRNESNEPNTSESSKSTSNNADSKKQSKKSEATVYRNKEQDTSDQKSNNECNKNDSEGLDVNGANLSNHDGKNPDIEKQRKVNGPKTSSRVRNSSETSLTGQLSDVPKTPRRSSSENVTDRIAQLINPSNPKAKAEVLKLVTQFSKSKRKENLVKLNQQTDGYLEKSSYSKKKLKYAPGSTSTPNQSANLSQRKESNKETVQEASNINPFSQKVPRKREKRKTNLENAEPQAKKTRKKAPIPGNLLDRQLLREVEEEKLRNGCSSKHKCSSAECLESCINDVVQNEDVAKSSASNKTLQKKTSKSLQKSIKEVYNPESISLNNQTVSTGSDDRTSRTVSDASKSHSNVSSNSENIQPRPVKQEIEASNMQFHPCLLEAFTLEEALSEQQSGSSNNPSGTIPVESLINLFASGTIKVKKEFDDPLIDVIRTVDPEILNQACEAQISGAAQSGSGNSPLQNSSPTTESALPTPEDNSVNEGNEADDNSNYPLLKASFKNILNEMQNISNMEEKVKTELQKAESKVQEFQTLLDEWKTKKIKLQSEEEILRKQRNSLVRTMADLVTQSNFENSEELLQATNPYASSLNVESNTNDSDKVQSKPHKSPSSSAQGKTPDRQSNSLVDDAEEIAILPVPDKSSNIPVIDLEDSDSETSQPAAGTEKSSGTDIFSENFSGTRDFPNHGASVNSLQVFEGYLYTCSNDSTARRVPLGKNTGMVVYNHQKRNVSQICVEKVRGLTLVFTICTGSKTVTAFKAKDGTPFRTYNLAFSVASLCKSKGLIYAGLRNGSIVVCNWKDHKELVNISEPIRSIDTTYQGRLNILVTLSVHGNVSIRDAERNGLLIRYVKARSYLPLFMTVCSDSVYLSSAGVMTVLNIESGTFSSKYSFSAAYTCLAVFRDSIFTASFSGLVRCYPKDEERLVKMYYGAGNNAVTCIHVHNGYVFTGNRFGAVSVFKHDPDTVHPCKMGKCDFLFPRFEDLKTHVMEGKYHVFPQPGSQCTWRKCSFVFPLVWEAEFVKIHITDHLHNQAGVSYNA